MCQALGRVGKTEATHAFPMFLEPVFPTFCDPLALILFLVHPVGMADRQWLTDRELVTRLMASVSCGACVRLKPQTAARLAMALERTMPSEHVPRQRPIPRKQGVFGDLHVRIDSWTPNGSIYQNLVQCRNVLVGRAAFAEAVKHNSLDYMTLRDGVRIIEERLAPTRGASSSPKT